MKTSLKGKYEHDKFYVHAWQTIDYSLAAIVMSGQGLLATSQSIPKVEGYTLGLGLG